MHLGSQITWLLVTGGALTCAQSSSSSASSSSTSCALTSGDTQVLQYTWALSKFLNNFYSSVALNSSVASQVSNSTSASKVLANLQGIEHADNLTVEAVRELSSKAPNFKEPSCSYTYPSISNIHSFVQYAYQFESTLCGAFIGAAGYTKSPEVSFLLARLAAEHSSHAIYISSRLNSSMFMANSSSLIPAYAPTQVLMTGNVTGSLGSYLGGCVSAPSNPCGALKIGPLEANITSSVVAGSSSTPLGGSSSSSMSSSASASGSASARLH
ncbi:uncharacterized protein N7498_008938 [Penicillium cinerascens]|uniref:Uncharacterized protein n=1 Tax=Penicillium cinerascens TaxID=70096 RepID=A0A9W9JEN4_9EURO|nr:uncharacterized protein N7498_008938 [Penicillium cinerascens]KAJ5195500.1 hypothetical protein N7498_008938 [Penicillium cinerascens]